MKIVKIIVATFMLAFITSSLFELTWIAHNPVRYVLVVLLIFVELVTGFFYAKSQSQIS